MSQTNFSIVSACPQPYAAAPILKFRLRIVERSGALIHTMTLLAKFKSSRANAVTMPVSG